MAVIMDNDDDGNQNWLMAMNFGVAGKHIILIMTPLQTKLTCEGITDDFYCRCVFLSP